MDGDITLMVVDQNEEVCERLARSLDRLPGIRVLAHTTNLILAAELAHESKPNLILADFKWSDAKRPDMLRWLGHMSPDSVLVVYSSYYTNGEREEFVEAGADLCLLKGMSVKQLAAQIHEAASSEHTNGMRRSATKADPLRSPKTPPTIP